MKRIALVGPTLGDVREVMIEGPSGLRSIEQITEEQPTYSVSRRRLEWPNGAVGLVFSAEDADSLRGPQFDAAWCDEIAAWNEAEAVWDNLQMGLRLGPFPRCVATTTPRPVPLVKRLVAGEAIVTRGGTTENAGFLSAGFIEQMQSVYGGTALGRQELGGELIEDPEGAMWRRSDLDTQRVTDPPVQFEDIVVAVDPPATSGASADACGIVAAGIAAADGFGQRCFVLRDASEQGLRPLDWGARVAALAREVGASRIVAEANQGGEMVSSVLESAGCDVPVRLVRAKLGKRARAMPVAALYERGDVCHVGSLVALEDEMCRFGAAGFKGSPDRVDALVWAVHALMLERVSAPRVRRV
jgi:phage terminase large subunit-like protein